MERDFKPGLKNLRLTCHITTDHIMWYKEKQMAKKSEPLKSIMIEGEEYFTVPALAEKYNVHAKRIHNCMGRLRIPRKQMGPVVLIKDDPRFDPEYKRPASGKPMAKGEDERRMKIQSYMEISNGVQRLKKELEEIREMIGEIYRTLMGREFGEIKMDDNGSTIDS